MTGPRPTYDPMDIPELLPCPFCGGEAKIKQTDRNEWIVECIKLGNCYGRCPNEDQLGYTYKEDAIDLWNRRTP